MFSPLNQLITLAIVSVKLAVLFITEADQHSSKAKYQQAVVSNDKMRIVQNCIRLRWWRAEES